MTKNRKSIIIYESNRFRLWVSLKKKKPSQGEPSPCERVFKMSTKNYNTNYSSCQHLSVDMQAKKILEKCQKKKFYNTAVIDWLYQHDEYEYAYNVEDCATFVGITDIEGVAKITKANFCRKRLCCVCAWRRQSKFVAQTFPVLEILAQRRYRFIFASVTVPNVPLKDLSKTINNMLSAYDRLLKRRKIKRAWVGKIRALEVTFNEERNDFHPHIHIMVAVNEEYFSDPDLYITVDEFRDYWEECLHTTFDYPLQVDIRAVDDDEGAVVETLKYSFKGAKDSTAIEGFFRSLRGRRLVSFSGVFAKIRKELRLSDFETVLTDDVILKNKTQLTYQLYKFDATGGVYQFYKEYELNV